MDNCIDIRLIGTEQELLRATETISKVYDIVSESRLYPCRDNTEKYRKYLKVEEKHNEQYTDKS